MARAKSRFQPLGNEHIELFRHGRRKGTIELIYWCPKYLEKHRAAPLLKEREKFLLHMLQQGTNRETVQCAGSTLLRAIDALKLKKLRELSTEDVNRAIQRIWGHQLLKHSKFTGSRSAYAFRYVVSRFLRFHGKFKAPSRPRMAFAEQLDGYIKFSQSRLLPSSLISARGKLACFLRWFATKKTSLSRASVADVDRFIAAKKAAGWSSATITSTTQCIRSFFRFATTQGWFPDIADGMQPPYHRQVLEVQQGRTWPEVSRLLKSTSGKNLPAIRAKAVFSLVSTYAMRSSEVGRLLLRDFDWRKGTFTVRRSKAGRLQRQPMHPDVQRAVLNYIRVRPPCGCRTLFVSLRPPYRSIGKSSFYTLTSVRMKKLGIKSGRLGPHAIRHARAIQLLKEGTPVREIAEFLGHRNPESSLRYAKFDVELLREVADFKLEGVL